MANLKAPFVRVIVVPKDASRQINISDCITSFVYDESLDKDNMIEMDIASRFVDTLSDIEGLDRGAELLFTFGYSNGAKSVEHRAVITDLEHTFENMNINMKLRALDKGTVLKNTASSQVYENVTSTDIAKLIAARHGLKFNVDVTEKVWDKQPQGNLDDLSFLRKLAQQEQAGNYIVFIKDDTLNFVRRGLDTKSLITYTYGQGNNGIIKFTPKWRESTAGAEGLGSTGVGFDPLKKLFDVVGETAESDNEVISTEDYNLVYSADGDHIANGTDNESISVDGFLEQGTVDGKQSSDTDGSVLSNIVKTGKTFVSGDSGKGLSNSVASGKKAKTQRILEAGLLVVGNPLLKVNALLTMRNVTKRYDGNWYIIACKHTINGGSYLTQITLNRNGSKKATKGKNTKVAGSVNKTVGNTTGVEDKIIILEYNANGERTADITQARNYVPPQPI